MFEADRDRRGAPATATHRWNDGLGQLRAPTTATHRWNDGLGQLRAPTTATHRWNDGLGQLRAPTTGVDTVAPHSRPRRYCSLPRPMAPRAAPPPSPTIEIPMQTSYRDLTCADARPELVGRVVTLSGWVNRRRDLGSLIFLDLRDRYGITQVVVDQQEAPEAHASASGVRSEFVLQVHGRIAARLAGTENAKLATGQVELRADDIAVLSTAKVPPFPINEPDAQIDETIRLKYRYLDLRREPLQRRILTRDLMVHAIRRAHHEAGFAEIETPLLIKSTPEGARDFIVPSRLQPGSVYALPQSPQQMKQLLMVSGMDRYFQIARCLRDEDLRGDRQPEFTQLDLEMSFVAEADVMAWVEGMAIEVSRVVAPERRILQTPFPVMTYREAIDRFGSDKPDLRYGLELRDLGEAVTGSGFGVFDNALAGGGRVFGFAATAMGGASRSQIDELTELAKKAGAGGLVWFAIEHEGAEVRGPAVKFVGKDRGRAIFAAAGGRPGDLVLVVADRDIHAQEALGKLRVEIGNRLKLADPRVLAYAWVHQFPMYQWDAENGRWDATHNPFSGVMPEDESLMVTSSGDFDEASPGDPAGRARALQYDVVLNGWELGGGSIRFHRRDQLARSFRLQGHGDAAMVDKFGGILEAFEYGAPPHGGIAIGIDRWAALFTDQVNIREVMAFPKTASGTDLMLDAPSPVEESQLRELGLALRPTSGP
jgi:aspartyl-tRNA synthetase